MTEEHLKNLFREYKDNNTTELSDEEIMKWIKTWLWVEDFMKKYEKRFGMPLESPTEAVREFK